MKTIGDLQGGGYILQTDSQDVLAILGSIGRQDWESSAGLVIVKLDDTGADYTEVWVSIASVPYLSATVYRILPA